MNILKALKQWRKKSKNSDFYKIQILPNGGFYMSTDKLFKKNKNE